MKRRPHAHACAVAFVLLLGGMHTARAAAPNASWQLMARHGECSDAGVLRRKVPELGDISDPQAVVKRLRELGHAVSSEALPGTVGQAVAVRAPSLGLDLVFATRELCARLPGP